MNLKAKISDMIGYIIYTLLRKKSINYHVSLNNLKKSKPKHIEIFDFSLLSIYNKQFSEVILYEKALNATSLHHQDNLSKRLRHYTLFQLLNQTLQDSLDGHVVECGCFKGQSAFGIATILKENKFKKSFLIFDSFEGLSDIAPNDVHEINDLSELETNNLKHQFAASLELVKSNLKDFEFIEYYKGWIPDRFDEVKSEKFSFVHIDVDLYQPIKDSLEFFYPRLADGGIICLDDYGLSQFPGAKEATDEFVKKASPSFFMYLPFGGAFIKK